MTGVSKYSSEDLNALLAGKLSEEQEREIAMALESDVELRSRLELMSGSSQWAIGSAPVPQEPVSASLKTAIERVVLESSIEIPKPSSQSSKSKLSSSIVARGDSVGEDDGSSGIGNETQLELPGIRIVREIGRGGMGIVYEGWDELVGRKVAIKQLHPIRSRSQDAKDQLLQEARSAGSLQHPNIVSIYGVHIQNDMPILVHQYVEGTTLQERIDTNDLLSWNECVDFAKQIAAGLEAAHAVGIVHRDLKPDNILIERNTGVVRIADFGIAKQSSTSSLSASGKIAGTPAYMSPEQTKGESLDARSDLFSLGSVLVAALTGKPPFGLDDPFVVMDRIRTQEPEYGTSLNDSIPGWFKNVLARLLVKDREHRMASSSHLSIALAHKDALVEKSEIGGAWRWPIGIAVAGLLAIVVWFSINNQQARKEQLANSAMREESHEDSFIPTKPVWIRRTATEFDSLASAVEAASDGDTIEVGNDLECRSVLVNKKLTIKGVKGKRPLLTSEGDEGKPADAHFLRIETDLTLDGIDIDWKAPESPIFEERRMNAVVGSAPGSRLVINDCRIKRSALGVNIATAGNLEIRDSILEGGSFAITWLGSHSHATIEESVISSRIGIAIMYPAPNVSIYTKSIFSLKNCVIQAEDAVSLMLLRRPEQKILVKADNCIFDSDQFVSLMSFNDIVRKQCETNGPALLVNSLEWKENRCVHKAPCEHLVSRRFRIPEWPFKTGISSLQDWFTLFPVDDNDEKKSVLLTLTELPENEETSLVRSYRMEAVGEAQSPSWVKNVGQTASKHQVIHASE